MNVPVEFGADIRNYLYLLHEQGMDVAELRERLSALESKVPEDQRSSSPEWSKLAEHVIAAEEQWDTGEPSGLEQICAQRPSSRTDRFGAHLDEKLLREKVGGGWRGRIAGCILGKPVECLMKHEDSRAKLKEILLSSGEYPLRDFVSEETMVGYWQSRGSLPSWYKPGAGNSSLRGNIRFAPADDDLNYTVLGLRALEAYGRDLTPDRVLDTWLRSLPFSAVCTAEKNAYRNRAMGLSYPETATFMNPYCEWIGAQIRADAYGYVCPGSPAEAARLAWNDAAASHVRNGIYGAMWVAACIAAAYVERDPLTVVSRGLEQVPGTCRLREHLELTAEAAERNGDDFEKTFEDIEHRLAHYHCVHTVNNACVVAAALVHGGHDFSRVITIAVMGGLDTDCNGATAGAIAGVLVGEKAIASEWKAPFNDTLRTSIVGRSEVKITKLIEDTLAVIGALGGAEGTGHG